jgi:hypothetical protein
VTTNLPDGHDAGTIRRVGKPSVEPSESPESPESLEQQVEDLLRRNRELLADMDRRAEERRREMEISLRRIEDARRTLRRAGILKPR